MTPEQLAETIRSEVDYIKDRAPLLTWGVKLKAFGDEGAAIASAIDKALKAIAVVTANPTVATGVDVAAQCRLGPLELEAAGPGTEFNGMQAAWSLGSIPPTQAAGFSETTPATIGYITITGNPTEDFEGAVEITSTGGVGVGAYRFSDDGGDNWGSPATIPVSFTHLGVTVAFSDEILVPDVVPEASGELPLFSSYTDGAVASWTSLGFDRLTLTLGETVETYDFMRPGATWFTEGSARSKLVGAASWDAETRPVPQTAVFSGGTSRTEAPVDEAAPHRAALDDAVARGTEWRRRWVLEISDHVVTRSQVAPPGI